jgi:hypothetical protein
MDSFPIAREFRERFLVLVTSQRKDLEELRIRLSRPEPISFTLSSFSNKMGFDSARLSGNPPYWPDNQGHSQVFAAAMNPFLHVGTRSFRNSVDS